MITGVVLARNEELNIVHCLESLRPHVSEILLIDMESDDRTVELARPYVSKVLSHSVVANFDPARNIAIREAQHDWLWFLDADERVPPETGRLVNEIVRGQGNELVAITIPFKSYFCGQWMQHCGWWPGYTMPRVLKRGHFQFAERLHGGVEFNGRGVRLPANPELAIDHFSYRDIEHYVEKFNRYTTTEAMNLANLGAMPDWEQGMRVLVRDLWLYYEKNCGVQDGYLGWILSWLAGQYRWFSHAKLADLPDVKPVAIAAPAPDSLDAVFGVMRNELARLRATETRSPLGMVFRTPLFDPSGYAEDARMMLKAAAYGLRAVTAVEIHWSDAKCQLPPADAALYRALLRGSPPVPAVSVTNCIPTLCEPDREAAFNVLRTLFETDRIPEYWLPRIESFDEVWVWAQHNATAFRRSGVAPERIRILPGLVDTELFTPEGPRLELPEPLRDRFVFLSVFDWQARKGWDVLLRAYCQQFSATDRTALLLKITRLHGYTSEQVRQQIDSVLNPLGHSLAERPDILLWDATLDQAEMAALYPSVNAFVLASRGEGWGRPYQEAMATELPTIGTRGSGNDDFMNESNSFLVDTSPVPVPDEAANEICVYRGHIWREPDLEGFRAAMRRVREDRDHGAAVGAKARRDMQEGYSLPAGTTRLESLLADVESRLCPAPAPAASAEQLHVQIEGEFFAGHSFSNINEQLALEWSAHDQVALTLKRVFHNPPQDGRAVHAYRLRPYFDRALDRLPDVVIRDAFPPNWQRPEHGRWIHIQPWEYYSLPRDWIGPLRDEVDEIWAPSNYVKDVYVRSGIPADKIEVIPWGVDPDIYRPDVLALHLPCKASFKFLYVGGSVFRKGIDVLLRAYLAEFAGDADVCLVIKDLGTTTFYRYGNYREAIRQAMADSSKKNPPIVYLESDMTDGQRASLYAACDCLVAPYRGEGFGLPVLEGMACGLPPIVPQGGATDDFVTSQDGFLVPATLVECDHEWRLTGPAAELAIDETALRAAMRKAYEDRAATKHKGTVASEKVRAEWTWAKSAERMVERMSRLCDDLAAGKSERATTDSSGNGDTGASPESRIDVVAERTDASVETTGVAAVFPLNITVCLVTENDEGVIADCLARVQPFVREIVVVDLESADRTAAIAREYGARVYCLPFAGSSSRVSNFALRRASSDWILRLTPEDRMDEPAFERMANMLGQIESPETAGFVIASQNGDQRESDVRLFRNHTQILYEGRAMERVTPSIGRLGGLIHDSQITVRCKCNSNGHSNGNGKAVHMLGLLHQDLAESPDDPDGYYRLGLAHVREGNAFHAECYLNEFLRRAGEGHPDFESGARLLVSTYLKIDDPLRAQEWESKITENGRRVQ